MYGLRAATLPNNAVAANRRRIVRGSTLRGALDTAVTQWPEMITKLTQLQTDAKAMKTKSDGSTWKGENATVTKEFVTKTAKEFSDAVTEVLPGGTRRGG